MENKQGIADFISKLHRTFPSFQNIKITDDGTFITLRFLNFIFSVDKRTPNAIQGLFKEAMEVAMAIKQMMRAPIEQQEARRIEEFRAAIIRQKKNAEQTAAVFSKVKTLVNGEEKSKRQKTNEAVESEKETKDISHLLTLLECNNSLINSKSIKQNWLEMPISSSQDMRNDSVLCKYIKESVSMNEGTDKLSNPIITKTSVLMNPLSFTINESPNTMSTSPGMAFEFDEINSSCNGTINNSFLTNSLLTNQASTIDNTFVENQTATNIRQYSLSAFVNDAWKHIYLGLIGIRNIDRVIAKAKERGLFKTNYVQFDADITLIKDDDRYNNFDFNISDIADSILDSESFRLQTITDQGSIDNSSLSQVARSNNSVVNVKRVIEDLPKMPNNTEKLNPRVPIIPDPPISVGNTSDDVKINNSVNIAKINDINSKDTQLPVTKTDPVQNSKYSQILDGRTIFRDTQDKTNSVEKKIDEVIQEHAHDISALFVMENNTSGFLFNRRALEKEGSYALSQNTSMLCDDAEPRSNDNKEVNNIPVPLRVSGTTTVARDAEFSSTDTALFKQIILDCKGLAYGYTEIIRRFCIAYGILFPEFEIVRENDVFRCTATFLEINFVSAYEYDKRDAKDGACKKILQYISRNWRSLFVTDE